MRFAVDVTQIHIDALCYMIVLGRENLYFKPFAYREHAVLFLREQYYVICCKTKDVQHVCYILYVFLVHYWVMLSVCVSIFFKSIFHKC